MFDYPVQMFGIIIFADKTIQNGENEYYKVDNFYRAAGFAQGILERGDTFRLLSIEAMPVGVGLEYFE